MQRITPSEQIQQKGLESMSEERHILSTFRVYGNWVDLDSKVWVNQKFQIIEFSLYILIIMINMLSYFYIPSVLKI